LKAEAPEGFGRKDARIEGDLLFPTAETILDPRADVTLTGGPPKEDESAPFVGTAEGLMRRGGLVALSVVKLDVLAGKTVQVPQPPPWSNVVELQAEAMVILEVEVDVVIQPRLGPRIEQDEAHPSDEPVGVLVSDQGDGEKPKALLGSRR
jgi:hypothetical protein